MYILLNLCCGSFNRSTKLLLADRQADFRCEMDSLAHQRQDWSTKLISYCGSCSVCNSRGCRHSLGVFGWRIGEDSATMTQICSPLQLKIEMNLSECIKKTHLRDNTLILHSRVFMYMICQCMRLMFYTFALRSARLCDIVGETITLK